jgi:PilZ domain
MESHVSTVHFNDLPAIGGPVHLEINPVLMVSGTIKLSDRTITFEPGLDARMLGRGPFAIPVADVTTISRSDGNRRVTLGVDKNEYIFRGNGAQRLWVALMAMQITTDERRPQAPMVFEESGIPDVNGGLYAIGAEKFGYASRQGRLGLIDSFWEDLTDIRNIRSVKGDLLLNCAGRVRAIAGDGAALFVDALAERCVSHLPPIDPTTHWQVRAVLHAATAIDVGLLTIDETGLRFVPSDGGPISLAPRGSTVVVRPGERDKHQLYIDVNGATHRVLVLDIDACIAVIDVETHSAAWRNAALGLKHSALPDEDISMLYGPISHAHLRRDGGVIASAIQTALQPNAYEVELRMVSVGQPNVETPFPGEFEITTPRGRFTVKGLVTRFTPCLAERANEQTGSPEFDVMIRFQGRVSALNRRDSFRVPFEVPVLRLRNTADGQSEYVQGGARVVNVSRGGCRVFAPVAPDVGEDCAVEIVMGDRFFSLTGRVMHVSPAGEEGQYLGIAFAEESLDSAGRLFVLCESASLRRRHEA